MSKIDVHVFSGVSAADPGGTGRLIRTMVSQAEQEATSNLQFHFKAYENIPLKQAIKKFHFRDAAREVCMRYAPNLLSAHPYQAQLLKADNVIMLHPQTLGYYWCTSFLSRRKKPLWMYVLDASFFCIRSYNHIPGENGACLRCLGRDNAPAKKMGCPNFPLPQKGSTQFLAALRKAAQSGHVRFLTQCESYNSLLKQHFGSSAQVHQTGLWVDFEDLAEAVDKKRLSPSSSQTVVFHASPLDPKGIRWALQLAEACPGLTFLFPFEKCHLDSLNTGSPPANARFEDMSWETGLRKAVEDSLLTLNPSLWSSPIEGALVKSIAHAPATAAVDEPTAYSASIPDTVLLKLPADAVQAGQILKDRVATNRLPQHVDIQEWIHDFISVNLPIYGNILRQIRAGGG
ncbi:MAG: hypothetical protein F6K39_03825 [Okeania sp. SIO3B3]|nr:hypothetical protein [Okeania sp. SIO3B3]